MDQAVATAMIAAVAVLLGVVIGRFLETKDESRRWWRDQRRAAYSQLLSSQQEFVHITSIAELDRGETQDVRTAWLATQQAASSVELAAPDHVAAAAKEFVATTRRYYGALKTVRMGTNPSVAAGLSAAQAADQAMDEVITARHTFVEAARKDLLRRD
jgi:hypothetical protein